MIVVPGQAAGLVIATVDPATKSPTEPDGGTISPYLTADGVKIATGVTVAAFSPFGSPLLGYFTCTFTPPTTLLHGQTLQMINEYPMSSTARLDIYDFQVEGPARTRLLLNGTLTAVTSTSDVTIATGQSQNIVGGEIVFLSSTGSPIASRRITSYSGSGGTNGRLTYDPPTAAVLNNTTRYFVYAAPPARLSGTQDLYAPLTAAGYTAPDNAGITTAATQAANAATSAAAAATAATAAAAAVAGVPAAVMAELVTDLSLKHCLVLLEAILSGTTTKPAANTIRFMSRDGSKIRATVVTTAPGVRTITVGDLT